MNEITKTPQQLEQEKIQEELETLATENCIIRVVAGSHAYGTNIPSSDWDERSIFVDEMKRVVLPFEKIQQVKYREDDKVAFELSRFMELLLQQNPNVIELLWTEDQDVLYKNDLGQLLIDNRYSFLSSKVKETYSGYASSQLNRIKGHNKWINSPQPEREPQQGDFLSVVWNQTNNSVFNKSVPKEGYTALSIGNNHYCLWESSKLGLKSDSTWIDKRGNPITLTKEEIEQKNPNNLPSDIIVKINFNTFETTHNNWKNYWTWKKNRNEKRGELEQKYGYDVKHAMHLIRLLRSGLDILKYGIVPVKRPDAEYLLDIRNGKYTYEEIVQESERLNKELDKISSLSKLPENPDKELAKEILLHIYQQQWNKNLTAKPSNNLSI